MTRYAVAIAVMFALVAGLAYAADDVTVKGVVSVTKDGDKVTAVTVKAGDVVYSVVLDEKGLELSKLDGKNVEVVGTVEKKEDKSVLTVKSSKVVEVPK